MPPKAGEVSGNVESVDAQSGPKSQEHLLQRPWSIADELLCPITLWLPVDPVIAEDGRIYERTAIQKHIDQADAKTPLKSPVTNQLMGPNLVSSLQIKNIIQKAIENRDIHGDLAENWKEKLQMKLEFGSWLSKAEKGDGEAMVEVAKAFTFALLGQDKDLHKGRDWWLKAADVDHVWGLTFRAYVLLTVDETCESIRLRSHGLILLSQAAERGSDLACFLLGMMYTDGNELLPVSKKRARYFLRKGLDDNALSINCLPTECCSVSNKCNICLFCDIKRKEAKEYLKQLEEV